MAAAQMAANLLRSRATSHAPRVSTLGKK